MSQFTFKKAERSQVYIKDAITGPTGSGKTLSALRLAAGLLLGTVKRIAFIDTENDSASLYSDLDEDQCRRMKIPQEQIASMMATSRLFDVMPIAPPYEATDFASGIAAAVAADYGAVVIDSASHLWKGILAYKDQIDAHGKGNSYTNWKQADAKFDPVIEAVLQSKIHLIFCMRSKMDYAQTEENGKKTVKKLGLAPIMRDGLEYEFTTVFDIGLDHSALASKDRSGLFPTDKPFIITEESGREIANWLSTAKPKAPDTSEADAAESERQQRIDGRTKAALDAKPENADADNWLAAYCEDASALVGRTPDRRTIKMEGFTTGELKLITKRHDEIVKLTTARVKP